MREFTVTMNAQITIILKDKEEEQVVPFDDDKKKRLETAIKELLNVDDAIVSDYKVFMMDNEDNA